MKRERVVARISISLTKVQLDALNTALRVRYGKLALETISVLTRANFLRLAVWAYCSAVVRLGPEYDMSLLACDVRRETDTECAVRNDDPVPESPPANILSVEFKGELCPNLAS